MRSQFPGTPALPIRQRCPVNGTTPPRLAPGSSLWRREGEPEGVFSPSRETCPPSVRRPHTVGWIVPSGGDAEGLSARFMIRVRRSRTCVDAMIPFRRFANAVTFRRHLATAAFPGEQEAELSRHKKSNLGYLNDSIPGLTTLSAMP